MAGVSIVHITTRGQYAIQALAFLLSRTGGGKPVSTSEICESSSLPPKYVEQILHQLKQSGILESKRGQNGGWSFARDPADISLGETLRTVEGRFTPLPAFLEHDKGGVVNVDALRALWLQVRDAVRDVMDSAPLTILTPPEERPT